jgi:hypothetical protein
MSVIALFVSTAPRFPAACQTEPPRLIDRRRRQRPGRLRLRSQIQNVISPISLSFAPRSIIAPRSTKSGGVERLTSKVP